MKVHIAAEGPVELTIEQILKAYGAEFASYADATLIVVHQFDKDWETMFKLYSMSKYFVLVGKKFEEADEELPPNVEFPIFDKAVFRAGELLSKEEFIRKGIEKTKAMKFVTHAESPVERIAGSGMGVLLVDDREENRAMAKELLAGYDLTLCSSYGQAMRELETGAFDAVLSDLYMPVSKYHRAMSFRPEHLGKQYPYGMMVVLEAARRGISAAVVTDANHHTDPFSAAFDGMGSHEYPGKTRFFNRFGKRWDEALQELLK